jgi:hypothetical protein
MGVWFFTTFFDIKKDDDLISLIKANKVAYTNNLRQAWDPKCENHASLKVTQIKEIWFVTMYYELKFLSLPINLQNFGILPLLGFKVNFFF